MDYITVNSKKWNTHPPLKKQRDDSQWIRPQHSVPDPKSSSKKDPYSDLHDLGGHYVLDFSQGQKSPLQTKHKQTLLKRINLLRIDLYL